MEPLKNQSSKPKFWAPIVFRPNLWEILILIFLLFSFCGYLFYLSFQLTPKSDSRGSVYLITRYGLEIISTVLAWVGVIFFFKTKLEIHQDRIRKVGIFKAKEILINEINGFRTEGSKYGDKIIFESYNPKNNLSYELLYNNRKDIVQWANENLIDLDAREEKEQLDILLTDEKLGENKSKREILLNRAKKWTWFINSLSLIISLWAWFLPTPFELVIFSLILIHIIAILSTRFFKRIIRFYEFDIGANPTIIIAFFGPPGALVYIIFNKWNLIDGSIFWQGLTAFAVLTIFYFIFLVVHNNNQNKNSKDTLGLFFYCIFYCSGLTIAFNCLLDQSNSITFSTQILGKNTYEFQGVPVFKINTTPWGSIKDPEAYSVNEDLFNKLKIGDTINIRLNKGSFNINWFDSNDIKIIYP